LILNKVIKPRVLVDTNLVGGTMALVSLEGLTPEYLDNYTMIYVIPPEKIDRKEIISVLEVGYMPYSQSFNSMGAGIGTINPNSMSDVLSAGQRVGDSVSNIPPISNATCDLVGYNTVVVRDQLRITNAYQLRCILANDQSWNNINPRSYLDLVKLCELAVKAYIYNEMIIKMDEAYLSGGQELGSIRTYVEGLSDSQEMYLTELRETWQKVAMMNDSFSYTRWLKIQINPGL
jgi:hypothetical protein